MLSMKQALVIANAQSNRFSTVLSVILGVVFLGCPHSEHDPQRLSERSIWILKSIPNRISKQHFANLKEHMTSLGDSSRLFNDINLRAETLSLYETDSTKVKVGRKEGKGLSSWKQVIVSPKQWSSQWRFSE